MGIAGKLTRADLTSSTPADSPLYPHPPYEYPGADLVVVEFKSEAEAVARLLPETVEIEDEPTVGVAFANYPSSTLGPYREVLVYIKANYQGSKLAANEQVQYAVRFYVTTDVAMAAGREQAGIPKKIGDIQFGVPGSAKLESGLVLTGSLERPSGTPIVSGSWQLVAPIPPTAMPPRQTFEYLALRLIPSPLRGASPSLCELVETQWVMNATEAWALKPTTPLTFGSPSATDSLAGLPIGEVTLMALIRGDMQVDYSVPDSVVDF